MLRLRRIALLRIGRGAAAGRDRGAGTALRHTRRRRVRHRRAARRLGHLGRGRCLPRSRAASTRRSSESMPATWRGANTDAETATRAAIADRRRDVGDGTPARPPGHHGHGGSLRRGRLLQHAPGSCAHARLVVTRVSRGHGRHSLRSDRRSRTDRPTTRGSAPSSSRASVPSFATSISVPMPRRLRCPRSIGESPRPAAPTSP